MWWFPTDTESCPYCSVRYKPTLLAIYLIFSNLIFFLSHCTTGRQPSELSIRVGSLLSSVGGQVSPIGQIIQHPSYNSGTQDNDLSILLLLNPVTLTNTVGVVSLPNIEPVSGTLATVSGWGVLEENGATSPVLQFVNVPIISRLQCRARYGPTQVTDNMICAGYNEGGRDSCQGDSGGPLALQGTNIQVGIVSWGIGCARPGRPGVYTNLARYLPWISQQTGQSLSSCDRLTSICNKIKPAFLCNFINSFC